MKMKRAIAAAMAAVMTATSCLVYELPAEAAAAAPYLQFVINGFKFKTSGKITLEDGTRTYELTATNISDSDVTIELHDAKAMLFVYCYDWDNVGSDYKVVSITNADGVNTPITNGDMRLSNGVYEYSLTESSEAVAAIGTVPPSGTIKVEVEATYDAGKKVINASDFTYSTKEFADMKLGDSFTITYDGTNAPDTAAFKIIYLTYRTDSGWTNHLYPVIYKSTDGGNGLNGTVGEDETGLKVSAEKTGERIIYTFTAVKATSEFYETKFYININVSQTGDFSDEKGVQGSKQYYIPTVPVSDISINEPARTTYKVGESVTLTASANGYTTVTAPEFVWGGDDEQVVEVDEYTGEVKFIGKGRATVVAAYKDDTTITDTIVFDVEDVPVSSVTIEQPDKTEYMVGESVILSASVNEDATVSAPTILWSSSDTKVATVDGSGEVKFVGEGSVTITAAYADDTSVKETITLTAVPDTRDTYIETPIDYTKATEPTLVKTSDGNSLLYVMAVTKAQAEADSLVFISVKDRDTGKTARYYTKDVYKGFGFIGENGQKYVETGADGIYFVIVKFTNNGAVMNADRYTVDMELITPVG